MYQPARFGTLIGEGDRYLIGVEPMIRLETAEVSERVTSAATDVQDPVVRVCIERFVLWRVIDAHDQRANVVVDERMPQDTIVERHVIFPWGLSSAFAWASLAHLFLVVAFVAGERA